MKTFNFAKRMENIRASEIRELLKITENPEIISFAGGLPAPELFPTEELAAISVKVLLEEGQKALQYSTTEGYIPLRKKIAGRMNRIFKTSVSSDEILITNGSQQALDMIGKAFIDEGDAIFCESPSYMGALNAFRAYGPKFVEVPTDSQGMLPEELDRALSANPCKKLIYVIPDFQNPTGRTWSVERREALAVLAEKHKVIVVEDNPYGELSFDGKIQPSVKSMDKNGKVIYLGTFSKTFCPGMRIGWAAAEARIIEKLALVKQGADLHTSTISQIQLNRYLEEYNLDERILKLREVYKLRRDTIVEAMEKYFPSYAKFNRPGGGLFTWAELPECINSRALLKRSLITGVAFVPGGSFFPCIPKENTMRINYSNMPEERIVEGIRRLGSCIEEMYNSHNSTPTEINKHGYQV
ncbi:MAG: PLP-dependent aminotransferase family protein [Clostridia bacterium]|nr:PLP-dependent aminotransferase family protein [Clostridia bacterium]